MNVKRGSEFYKFINGWSLYVSVTAVTATVAVVAVDAIVELNK